MKSVEEVLDFDFGFSVVSEDELEVVQVAQRQSEQLSAQLKEIDDRAKKLYDTVIPLIKNLKANKNKDYIYWPNRQQKLEEFEVKLRAILNGEI